MKDLNTWLRAYSQDHQNPKNIAIHKVCIPLIMFSLLGLLFVIPFPVKSQGGVIAKALLSWAMVLEILALIFYLFLSFKDALVMLVIASAMIFTWSYLDYVASFSVLKVSVGIFVASWVMQFWGHKIEGRKPSFFEDIQFLLIGPLWTLHSLIGDLPSVNNLHPNKNDSSDK